MLAHLARPSFNNFESFDSRVRARHQGHTEMAMLAASGTTPSHRLALSLSSTRDGEAGKKITQPNHPLVSPKGRVTTHRLVSNLRIHGAKQSNASMELEEETRCLHSTKGFLAFHFPPALLCDIEISRDTWHATSIYISLPVSRHWFIS